MRKRWLGAMTALLTTAGLALSQSPQPTGWTPNLSPYHPIESPPAAGPVTPAQYLPDAPPTPPAGAAPGYEPPCGAGDCRGERVWFAAEYLLWWLKPNHTARPVLFGTIPNNLAGTPDLPADAIGSLPGAPGRVSYGSQNGLRLGAGVWLDPAREWGVDGSWFQLERKTQNFHAVSDGTTVIGPVYDDPVTVRRTIILYSIPGARAAALDSELSNRLWSAELNLRHQLPAVFFADRLDFLLGFRHVQFGEGLDLSGTHTAAPGYADPVARVVSYSDHFGVQNKFYGGQVGLASHTDAGPFTVDLIGKLALGGVHEVVTINGSTTLTDPVGAVGTTVTHPGGVLAQPTNIGRYHSGDFAVVPEVTLNLGWQVTPWLRTTVGYNLLFVTQLYRAGNQVGPVDGRQVFGSTAFVPNAQPAPVAPQAPSEANSLFWAQGLNAGVELSW